MDTTTPTHPTRRFAVSDSEGVITLVGSRNITRALDDALEASFRVEHHDTPTALLRVLDKQVHGAMALSLWRLVIIVQDVDAASGYAHAPRMATSWLRGLQAIHERLPNQPILVVADEFQPPDVLTAALNAGAHDWISRGNAQDAALLLYRVRTLLAWYTVQRSDLLTRSRRDSPVKESPQARSEDEALLAREPFHHRERTEPSIGARRKAEMRDRVRAATHGRAALQSAAAAPDLMAIPVPADLRASSGRLHAKRLAEALGLSLRKFADLLPVSPQALSETPDSPSAQGALYPFARIVTALRAMLSPTDARAWLQTPNARWEGRTPQAMMLAGEAEAVARALEGLLEGGGGA